MSDTLRSRLLSRLVKEDGPLETPCVVWTGCTTHGGYGQIWVGRGVYQLTHRVAYELYVGPIPPEMYVLHRCDVPQCCRPDHLYLGTYQDNSDDKYERGRAVHYTGSRNGNSRLADEDVKEVFVMLEEGCSQAFIARHFGVSTSTVNGIVLGKGWRDFPVKRRPKRRTSSIFSGVSKYRDGERWTAQCRNAFGKQVFLGIFKAEVEAAQAWNAYVLANGLNRELNVIPDEGLTEAAE